MAQVTQQYPFVGLAKARIVEAFEHAADVRVALLIVLAGGELHHCAGDQKLFNLRDCREPRLAHVDHHFLMINPPSLGACNRPFRLIPRWTRLSLAAWVN
ncbi:hypothetical protein [Verminephrobacter aporrectodeae]|uniref:hypothetical protein n=1 Tax=Verminephrobacter aporrectodeae TaxID=1110389 RepID=UPI002237772A|nr:hypothetical protein [Verminephrobacter aporrectodeae]